MTEIPNNRFNVDSVLSEPAKQTLCLKETKMKYSTLVFLLLIYGCGQSVVDQTLWEFKSQNPEYSVVDAFIGEGDSDNVYVHIKYKEPNNNAVNEAIYLHQRTKDGEKLILVEE